MTGSDRPLRVLLVEDDPGDRRLVEEALRGHMDLHVSATGTLHGALAAIDADERPDVVVLDLGLPDSRGLDTYRQVSRRAGDVPILVLSGDDDQDRALAAVSEGAQDFIHKGAGLAGLPRAIAYAFERATLHTQLATSLRHREGLLEIGQTALDAEELQSIIAGTVQVVRDALGIDHAVVAQRLPDGSVRVHGSTHDLDPTRPLPTGRDGFVVQILRETTPVRSRDLTADPRFRDDPLVGLGAIAAMGVVLQGADEPFGVLGAYHGSPHDFTAQDAEFLAGAARTLASAFRRQAAERDVHERVKELRGLGEVQAMVQSDAATPDAVGQLVVDALHAAMERVPDLRTELVLHGSVWATGAEGPLTERTTRLEREVANGTSHGTIRVLHLDGSPFLLPHEQHLVDGIADTLGTWLARRDANAAVAERQRQLDFLVAQLPGTVWTTDTELYLTRSLGRGLETMGQQPDEVVGMRLHDIAETARDATLEAHERALRGEHATYIFGEHDEWHASVEPMIDDAGTVTGVIGVALDLSAQRAAEAAKRESEARLQAVMDQIPGVVWTADTDLTITSHTGRAHATIGLEPGSLIGTSGERFMGQGSPSVAAAWRALRGQSSLVEEEFAGRSWELHVSPLYTAQGRIEGVIGLGMDVTEIKRAQLALQESEERFRRLAENAQDVIFRARIGPDFGFEYVSPALETVLGYTPQEFYDDPELAISLMHPDDRAAEHPSMEHPSGRAGMRVRWRHRDGHYVWVDERHTYVRDEAGNIIASEGVVRDITEHVQIEDALREALAREQEATERLRELDELKNAFLTGVSHEMRTPLTSIVGLTDALVAHGDRLDAKTQVGLIGRVDANARRLHRLLTDLLDVDRLAQGVIDVRYVDASLPALVRRVIEDVTLDDHPLHVHGDEDAVVAADVPRLERIVEHLVHNAVRHTPRGTPIEVSWRPTADGTLLQVDDAGPGVPDALKESIFEPFRLGDTDAARVGGTGIGLAMVRRFAHAHGGHAWVEDGPDGGASFRVLLTPVAGAVADLTERGADVREQVVS